MKKSKESEHLTQIPKPHLSTSLTPNILIITEPKKNLYDRPPTRSGSDKKVDEEPETAVSKQGNLFILLILSYFKVMLPSSPYC